MVVQLSPAPLSRRDAQEVKTGRFWTRQGEKGTKRKWLLCQDVPKWVMTGALDKGESPRHPRRSEMIRSLGDVSILSPCRPPCPAKGPGKPPSCIRLSLPVPCMACPSMRWQTSSTGPHPILPRPQRLPAQKPWTDYCPLPSSLPPQPRPGCPAGVPLGDRLKEAAPSANGRARAGRG